MAGYIPRWFTRPQTVRHIQVLTGPDASNYVDGDGKPGHHSASVDWTAHEY